MVATRTGRETKTEAGGGSVTSHDDEQSQQSPQQGNLGSLLTHYESQKNNNNTTDGQTQTYNNQSSSSVEQKQPQAPAPLTINIPSGIHSGADGVKEEDRDRSLTMGSEFDQIFNHLGKDGRGMSISGLFTPVGDAMSEGTSTTAISGSTSSTYNSAGGQHQQVMVGAAPAPQSQAPHLPRLPENTSSSSGGIMAMDATPITSNYTTGASRAIPVGGARGRGESHGSAAMFLNGIYNNNSNLQQQQKQQHQPISHTPPTHLGTSYENSHFGKRMRAGVSFLISVFIYHQQQCSFSLTSLTPSCFEQILHPCTTEHLW